MTHIEKIPKDPGRNTLLFHSFHIPGNVNNIVK